MLECLIKILEAGVKDLPLKPWLQLLKEDAILHYGNIISEFLAIEVTDTTKNGP